ncbi:3-carboxy-cis,cis-muconate cycloisomerase [Nocardioides terrae]|uniref:3-carboxy-cis,cis-muconate cycloisomerase n=1 Tax=Nocardioides terrae TaxID=574651 RepID=A0A1I1HBI6_9ACTN|nr:lyase family protein [Nocardioides terrae]SFC18863.1 3-carboxy-cis,cis-muconate cycloisomerase [Nocardioides terrae]
MSDLLWPGDERAGSLFSDAALLDAMVRAEQAWLDALAVAGIAPSSTSLDGVVGVDDLEELAAGAETGGNPVIGLVRLLRERTGSSWVHRGLTSQDVLDTALVLCLRDALDQVLADVERQARALAGLVRAHRGTVMAGRTLTQHAVPITFGLKASTWLLGLVDSAVALRGVRDDLPGQAGGAAGTMAATVELAQRLPDPVAAATGVLRTYVSSLGLQGGAPWHTRRTPITGAGDALVTVADTWGRLGGDVALLSRPEIGELREALGGGSSTMPGKANPVLSVLLRRHALAAPGLAATLHVAASSYVDERPDGGWHAEWDTLRTLARRSVVAASQAADLLEGLVVDAERMAARAAEADQTLRAEQRSMTASDGGGEPPYLGATDLIIDNTLERAARVWSDL